MGGMRGWTELCSDVNWEDYHGMWAKKGPDGAWYVLQWTNMVDACGDDGADLPYECDVKRLDLREVSEAQLSSVSKSCDLRLEDLDEKFHEVATLESCISYGLGAPLESFTGKVRPLSVRAEARRFAETCMRDAEVLDRQLDRPVNAIGSTAREYGLGDIDSALMRGDSPTHKLMRKLHGIPEEPARVIVRKLRHSSLLKCPHRIMIPVHYRDDETCRCDDPEHRAMMIRDWGYSEGDFAKEAVSDEQ